MAKSAVKKPVAVVTGAASGIGLATAGVLLAAGWKVALFDRVLPTLTATKGATTARQVDITDEAAVGLALDEVWQSLGPVTGVVNSAGIASDVPALETSVERFRQILDVNVIGSFIVAREAALRMRRDKVCGAIVNLSSISGLRGSKGRVAYGASKGAVITMTQVLANELAPSGIRVNAVAPGPVETAMVAKLHTDADRALFHRFVPMARYADPTEIAEAIAFLLSDKASFITGEVLAVDGGYHGAGLISARS